jgi:hypothetical protein
VRDPSGTGPFITWGPPSPAGAPTRLHLDLAPLDGDVGGEVQRLVSLGATVLDRAAAGGHGVLLADPDCTELCVVGR